MRLGMFQIKRKEINKTSAVVAAVCVSHDDSGGQSTQIKYLSKSTDTYNKILLQ